MHLIDGSLGEGGGQILRTSLALSAITGIPVTIEHIRAKRPKPGLQRQHLVAVLAAAQVCGGQVDGAELHSRKIIFYPQQPQSGDYHFSIGSAGSATLVLQTIMPILAQACGTSQITISGGTHNGMAPPVEFLTDSLFPLLYRVGFGVSATLERHGFYPAGGGKLRAVIHAGQSTTPLLLTERGKPISQRAQVLIANLPSHVAMREAQALKHALHWSHAEVDEVEVDADGPGNAIIISRQFSNVTQVCSAFGEIRKSSERVASEATKPLKRLDKHNAPVCEHLADQLLLPLALGIGGQFRTVKPSDHTTTNAAVIAQFLGERVKCEEIAADDYLISVRGSRA
jgi:RNA 3'-terminal phosphate cyclase (ATP)